jgi:hypothetical protein
MLSTTSVIILTTVILFLYRKFMPTTKSVTVGPPIVIQEPISLNIDYRELIYTDLYIGDKKVSAIVSTESGTSFIKSDLVEFEPISEVENIETDIGEGYFRDVSFSQNTEKKYTAKMFILNKVTASTSIDASIGLNFFTSTESSFLGHKSFVLSPERLTLTKTDSDGWVYFTPIGGKLHLGGTLDPGTCRSPPFIFPVNRNQHGWSTGLREVGSFSPSQNKAEFFGFRDVLWSTDHAVSVIPEDLSEFLNQGDDLVLGFMVTPGRMLHLKFDWNLKKIRDKIKPADPGHDKRYIIIGLDVIRNLSVAFSAITNTITVCQPNIDFLATAKENFISKYSTEIFGKNIRINRSHTIPSKFIAKTSYSRMLSVECSFFCDEISPKLEVFLDTGSSGTNISTAILRNSSFKRNLSFLNGYHRNYSLHESYGHQMIIPFSMKNIKGDETLSWSVVAGIDKNPRPICNVLIGLNFSENSEYCSSAMMSIKNISFYPRTISPLLVLPKWTETLLVFFPFGKGEGIAHFGDEEFDIQNECKDPLNVLSLIADPAHWDSSDVIIEFNTGQRVESFKVLFDTGCTLNYLPKKLYDEIFNGKKRFPTAFTLSSKSGSGEGGRITIEKEFGLPLFLPLHEEHIVIGLSTLRRLSVNFSIAKKRIEVCQASLGKKVSKK